MKYEELSINEIKMVLDEKLYEYEKFSVAHGANFIDEKDLQIFKKLTTKISKLFKQLSIKLSKKLCQKKQQFTQKS